MLGRLVEGEYGGEGEELRDEAGPVDVGPGAYIDGVLLGILA